MLLEILNAARPPALRRRASPGRRRRRAPARRRVAGDRPAASGPRAASFGERRPSSPSFEAGPGLEDAVAWPRLQVLPAASGCGVYPRISLSAAA
jgi:hypothetical protein